MKKRILIALLIVLTLLAMLFAVSCSGDSGDGGNGDTNTNAGVTYTVKFNATAADGKPSIPNQTVAEGGKVTAPDVELTKKGDFVFDGWYVFNNNKKGAKWDFANDTVTQNLTLRAYFVSTGSGGGAASSCNHNWQETSRREPTCKKEGEIVKTCSICKKVERIYKDTDPSLARLEHIEQVERVEPGCGTTGYVRVFCENGCGLDDKKILDPTGDHTYEMTTNEFGQQEFVWKVTLEATNYSYGEKERLCTVCGGGRVTTQVPFKASQLDFLYLDIINYKYTGGKYVDEPFVNIASFGSVKVPSYFTGTAGQYINDGDITKYWSADTYADGADFTKDYVEIEFAKAYEVGSLRFVIPYYTAWDLGDDCYVSYMISYWDEEAQKYVEYGEISDKNATPSGSACEIMVTFPEPITTTKFRADVKHATRYAPATIYELEVYAKTAEIERVPDKAIGGAAISISGKYNDWVAGAEALTDGLLATYWTTDANKNPSPYAMYEYTSPTYIIAAQWSVNAFAGNMYTIEFFLQNPAYPEGVWMPVGSAFTVPKNAEEAAKDPSIIFYDANSGICTFETKIDIQTTKVRLNLVKEGQYWTSYIYEYTLYTVKEQAKGESRPASLCTHKSPSAVKVDYVDEYGNPKQKDKVIDPTCTSAGYQIFQCTCGHILTSNATDALGHDFGDYEVSVAATETALGTKISHCTAGGCNATREINYHSTLETPTITDYFHNANGAWAQSFDDGNYLETYEWVVPQLLKYNYKATLVMSITYGNGLVKEWTEWFSTGAFDLGSHSYNHTSIYASTANPTGLLKEVVDAQYWFRGTFPGQKVLVFAAPLGATSDAVANYLCGPMVANRNGGQTGIYMNTIDQLETRKTAGNVNSWISKADQTEGDYVFVNPDNINENFEPVYGSQQKVDKDGKPVVDNKGEPVMEQIIIGYIPFEGSYDKTNGTYTRRTDTNGEYVLLPNQRGEFVYVKKGINLVYDAEAGTFVDKQLTQGSYKYVASEWKFVLTSNAGYNVTATPTGETVVLFKGQENEKEVALNDYSYTYSESGKYRLVKASIGSYEGYIDKIVEENSWTVECIHSLGSGSIYSSYDSTISKYEYLKVKGVWTCSYNEIVQYRKQYASSVVNVISVSDTAMELSLVDSVDDTMFDHALTIKVDIPDEWTNVVVKQGDTVIEQVTMEEYKDDMTKVSCVIDAGYIYIDAYPDSDNITITVQ